MVTKPLRARVSLCTSSVCNRDDRHWLMACPDCPKNRFHCRTLPDAHQLETLHITHQHPREAQ